MHNLRSTQYLLSGLKLQILGVTIEKCSDGSLQEDSWVAIMFLAVSGVLMALGVIQVVLYTCKFLWSLAEKGLSSPMLNPAVSLKLKVLMETFKEISKNYPMSTAFVVSFVALFLEAGLFVFLLSFSMP